MIRPVLSILALIVIAGCGPQIEDSSATSSPQETPDPGVDPTPTPNAEPYKPLSLDQAWARFGACMQLAEWEQTGMPEVAWQAADSEAGGGRCFSCHETGTGGALLSIDGEIFFEENRKKPFVMKLVLGTVNENGAFEDLVPSWRFRDKGIDPNHPEYILTEEREQALEDFVNLTLERYHQYDVECAAPTEP